MFWLKSDRELLDALPPAEVMIRNLVKAGHEAGLRREHRVFRCEDGHEVGYQVYWVWLRRCVAKTALADCQLADCSFDLEELTLKDLCMQVLNKFPAEEVYGVPMQALAAATEELPPA